MTKARSGDAPWQPALTAIEKNWNEKEDARGAGRPSWQQPFTRVVRLESHGSNGTLHGTLGIELVSLLIL